MVNSTALQSDMFQRLHMCKYVRTVCYSTDGTQYPGPGPALPQASAGLGGHGCYMYSQLRPLTQSCVCAQLSVAATGQAQQASASLVRRQHHGNTHVHHTGEVVCSIHQPVYF